MITQAAPAAPAAAAAAESMTLQCMEVWGGNRFVSTSVRMNGVDAWVYSLPADGEASDGGGDVHYVSSCASGQVTRIMVADVSGHGPDAAETARRLRRLMQRHVNQHDQARFVRALSGEFDGLARHGRFATAVAFTYDAPPNRLLVCNAGHPAPLIYRSRSREWSFLQPPEPELGNVPLGIVADVEYQEFSASVEHGDIIISYTDALTEARRGSDMLGEEGVLERARTVDLADPAALIPQLIAAVTAAGFAFDDDLTLLVFRPNGGRKFIPLYDRVMAPVRFFRGIARGQVALP